MNILLVIPTNVGTIASISYDLYNGLCKQQNINVYVACLGEYSEDGFHFNNVVSVRKSNSRLKRIFSRVRELREIKRRYAIDESISTLLGATYWNVLSGIGENKVGVFHTRLEQMKYSGYLFYLENYFANKILCSRLNKMIAVNKSAYLDLIRLHGNSDRIELVYNIHDFSKINRLSLEYISDEKERALFENPVVLYVGNLYCNVKGTDRLLRAFRNFHSSNHDYKLVYIGDASDDSLKRLQSMCVMYGLDKSVYFLGRKKNPYKYMKHARMLVSPSRDEGLPGVLIEALSLGLKVVATNSTIGVWEIMECAEKYDENLGGLIRTNYGYICPNNLVDEDFTVENLALAIEKCLTSQFEHMGAFNKRRFSEDEIVPHYVIK